MKKRIIGSLLAFSCVVCVFVGCSAPKKEDAAPATAPPTVETVTTANATVSESEKAESDGVETLFRRMADSTLCIFTSTGSNGTGFLYGDKYLITNAHVLYEAESFTLLDRQGIERQGTVVFTDDGEDIAVIELADYQGTSVTFGDSDALPLGQQVLLIGNPADGEPFSHCTGRRVKAEGDLFRSIDPKQYLPVDAPIVSGYSGGPAFNMRGELIGISNAAFTEDLSEYGFEHLGLLIPINRVKELIEAHCG